MDDVTPEFNMVKTLPIKIRGLTWMKHVPFFKSLFLKIYIIRTKNHFEKFGWHCEQETNSNGQIVLNFTAKGV